MKKKMARLWRVGWKANQPRAEGLLLSTMAQVTTVNIWRQTKKMSAVNFRWGRERVVRLRQSARALASAVCRWVSKTDDGGVEGDGIAFPALRLCDLFFVAHGGHKGV